MKFTYLRIIEEFDSTVGGYRICRAKCGLCGNVVTLRSSRVRGKEQLSCGCVNKLKPKTDVTGCVINSITFVGYMSEGDWKVKYQCGHFGVTTKDRAERSVTGLCWDCSAALPKTTRHGHAQRSGSSREYSSWLNMKRRCYDENNNRFGRYGERGIRVCERWLESFENFFADMGECPDGYSIERKDLDNGYSKENCVWACNITQANNKSNNILIQNASGTVWSLRRWCEILDKNYKTCWHLLKRKGLPVDSILGAGYTLIQS